LVLINNSKKKKVGWTSIEDLRARVNMIIFYFIFKVPTLLFTNVLVIFTLDPDFSFHDAWMTLSSHPDRWRDHFSFRVQTISLGNLWALIALKVQRWMLHSHIKSQVMENTKKMKRATDWESKITLNRVILIITQHIYKVILEIYQASTISI